MPDSNDDNDVDDSDDSADDESNGSSAALTCLPKPFKSDQNNKPISFTPAEFQIFRNLTERIDVGIISKIQPVHSLEDIVENMKRELTTIKNDTRLRSLYQQLICQAQEWQFETLTQTIELCRFDVRQTREGEITNPNKRDECLSGSILLHLLQQYTSMNNGTLEQYTNSLVVITKMITTRFKKNMATSKQCCEKIRQMQTIYNSEKPQTLSQYDIDINKKNTEKLQRTEAYMKKLEPSYHTLLGMLRENDGVAIAISQMDLEYVKKYMNGRILRYVKQLTNNIQNKKHAKSRDQKKGKEARKRQNNPQR